MQSDCSFSIAFESGDANRFCTRWYGRTSSRLTCQNQCESKPDIWVSAENFIDFIYRPICVLWLVINKHKNNVSHSEARYFSDFGQISWNSSGREYCNQSVSALHAHYITLTHLRFRWIICCQREHNSALRFDAEVADRDQPPPNIPEGPAHKWAIFHLN